jgi:hypothetical protein
MCNRVKTEREKIKRQLVRVGVLKRMYANSIRKIEQKKKDKTEYYDKKKQIDQQVANLSFQRDQLRHQQKTQSQQNYGKLRLGADVRDLRHDPNSDVVGGLDVNRAVSAMGGFGVPPPISPADIISTELSIVALSKQLEDLSSKEKAEEEMDTDLFDQKMQTRLDVLNASGPLTNENLFDV